MPQTKSRLYGVAGIDEAGRGPMIGPMVVCGVLMDSAKIPMLKTVGIRDSKLLTPKRRTELNNIVIEMATKISLEVISAAEIDQYRKEGSTINEIEVLSFVKILKTLRPAKAYMDAVDVIAKRFGETITEKIGPSFVDCKLVAEHKADLKYPIVSAASIVAKVERDRLIGELHAKYGDFGSGYPTDQKTIDFVKELVVQGDKLPPIIRSTWDSVKKIELEAQTRQTTLEDG